MRALTSFSKKIRKRGGEFLLVPHLNKKSFSGIEKQNSTIETLINLQVDSGSSSIIIPDYWKYTSSEYKRYLKWWLAETERYSKPVFATLLPSVKESRIKKRLQEISGTKINGILVHMRGNINDMKFTTTFSLLLKIRERLQKPNRAS